MIFIVADIHNYQEKQSAHNGIFFLDQSYALGLSVSELGVSGLSVPAFRVPGLNIPGLGVPDKMFQD